MKSGLIRNLLILLFVMCLVSGVSAQETITLTTYYPSPFGVYSQLEIGQMMTLRPRAPDPAECDDPSEAGRVFYSNVAGGGLQVCDGISWSSSLGAWEENPANNTIYPKADLDRQISIGTSTPSAGVELQVDSADGDATLRLQETQSTNAVWEIQARSGNPNNGFGIWGGAEGTEADRLAITTAGDVGIATTAPAARFHVEGGDIIVTGNAGFGAATVPTQALDVTGNAAISANATIGGTATVTGATTLQDTLGVALATTLGTTLDVGGATTLLNTLDVSLATTLLTSASVGTNFRVGGTSEFVGNVAIGGAPTVDKLDVNGNVRIDGRVGINGPWNGSRHLDVNGDIEAAAFYYASDERLKENIQPIAGLASVMKLEGVQYTWKENGQSDIGITAQNVEEVFPEIVDTNAQTGLKSVKADRVIAPLIEAIKEQQQMIEAQQKQIETLKSEMEALKGNAF